MVGDRRWWAVGGCCFSALLVWVLVFFGGVDVGVGLGCWRLLFLLAVVVFGLLAVLGFWALARGRRG